MVYFGSQFEDIAHHAWKSRELELETAGHNISTHEAEVINVGAQITSSI